MDIQLVLETFMLFSGLTKEEAESWLPLCHWAITALYGKLRVDVDLTANQALLGYAAGAMAYYKYVLRNAAKDGATTFSAGDVKVTEHTGQTAAVAKELYQTAMDSVVHLFEDDFVFMGALA